MSDNETSTPLTWTVGEATITSVAESETPTSPKFLFDGVNKAVEDGASAIVIICDGRIATTQG